MAKPGHGEGEPLSCLLVLGGGEAANVFSLFLGGFLWPMRMNPGWVTLVCAIWAFFLDTIYPLRRLDGSEASLGRLMIRMLSAQWRRVPSSRWRSFRSLAKVSPKVVEGTFWTSEGRTVQQYCFCYMFGSSHWKAKLPYESGTHGVQKKSSLKSHTEYQALVNSRVVSWMQRLGMTGGV